MSNRSDATVLPLAGTKQELLEHIRTDHFLSPDWVAAESSAMVEHEHWRLHTGVAWRNLPHERPYHVHDWHRGGRPI